MRWYIVSAILIVLAIEVCCLNTKEENRLSDRGYTKFSKRIERLMLGDYKRHSTRGQDGEWNVWVIFVDKGRISQSRQVLDSLHPNAIERRRKHRYTLVDDYDFPVSPSYVQQVLETARKFGRVEVRRTSKWMNGVSMTLYHPSQLDAIAELECVNAIDVVGVYRRNEQFTSSSTIDEEQPLSKKHTHQWPYSYGKSARQLELLDVPNAHKMGLTGYGIRIAVFDSGFSLSHPSLQHLNISATWDFVDDDPNVDLGPNDATNIVRHGTAVLSNVGAAMPGELYGPAFNATFLLARTEDVNDEAIIEEDNFVAALEWAEQNGADIVSASLGYSDWYDWRDMDGETAITTRGVNIAVEKGMLVLIANGNSGDVDRMLSAPADAKNIIAVGAIDGMRRIASFSSYGPTYDGRIKPEVVVQGKDCRAARSYDNGYEYVSGTSFSTPIAAGVAALVMEAHPEWTNLQVREALIKSADLVDNSNLRYGFGVINVTKAILYTQPSCSEACLHGTCVDGVCMCQNGTYNMWCDAKKVACSSYCDGSCTDEGECLCAPATFDGRCSANEQIPPWTCPYVYFNRGDGVCNCDCTRYDPDCDRSPNVTIGCAAGEVCYHYHMLARCISSGSRLWPQALGPFIIFIIINLVLTHVDIFSDNGL